MRGEYLSNIVNVEDVKTGGLNLIYAPCGSGKTTFARTKLININPNPWGMEMLYLIDGSVGKEQLLRSQGAICEENLWTGKEQWRLPGIKVMTYAGYALLHQKGAEYDGWQEESLIVCDELHNEVAWSKWKQEDNIHKEAIDLISTRINIGKNIVVAMSATPNKIRNEFSYCLNEIELNGEPRHYENENVEYYSNLSLLLSKIKPKERGVIYITRIEEILKYKELLDSKGIRTAGLWSISNTKFPLTEEQEKIRTHIIERREIPDYVDVLFVNKCFETSISMGNEENTKNPIDFMIIHTSEEDSQIQVRGRYRNDLKNLYLYKKEVDDLIELDRKWLFKKLTKADKDKLCEELAFKDKNGRLLKWTSIKSRLEKSGYIVETERTSKERFVTISEL